MGGRDKTPALTALLCLGLCWAPGDGAQAGTLPKPSIWADPGPLVAVGSPVTLWCQGSLQAEVYRVYKEGSPQPWEVQAQQDSRHKADFPITMSMSSYHTGQYWCVYRTPLGLSQPSDPLTLVVTGGPEPSSPSHPQPGSPTGPSIPLLVMTLMTVLRNMDKDIQGCPALGSCVTGLGGGSLHRRWEKRAVPSTAQQAPRGSTSVAAAADLGHLVPKGASPFLPSTFRVQGSLRAT
ncbi:leukocyte immunoglobulin-like receptor subfamily A member 6 isoform X3 [Oryctolagus cuniculus]|uniref:leukocyte immunoglobulin-like receptor subfamily A member 6 isoform X3 n=1 Tax=Oryctolagus cuniculus TaxID=9986 RepID=UPI003879090D